mgnify:CR=1 FL=1
MGRSSEQLMSRLCGLLLLPFRLSFDPPVPYHLPCKSPTKSEECGTSLDSPFPEGKVPEAEEGVHLGDRKDEREDTRLPPL